LAESFKSYYHSHRSAITIKSHHYLIVFTKRKDPDRYAIRVLSFYALYFSNVIKKITWTILL